MACVLFSINISAVSHFANNPEWLVFPLKLLLHSIDFINSCIIIIFKTNKKIRVPGLGKIFFQWPQGPVLTDHPPAVLCCKTNMFLA